MISPLAPFLDQNRFVVLDGGLATELENRGHDLGHPLWSARMLLSNPAAIREVHRSYLNAGADCLTTASYQASIPGLVAEGLTEQEAIQVLQLSVAIACEVRDEAHRQTRPLVAASVGPYGACLADGSEYVGQYGITQDDLRAFHELRWQVLSESGADLLACETIPSIREAEVLLELINATQNCHAWISFSCRDGEHISDGTPITICAAMFEDCRQVVAVGVNCTSPQYISSLVANVRLGAPSKRIIVYPNSGRGYDVQSRVWTGNVPQVDFAVMAREWWNCGATLIGGCCGTGPRQIQAIREACSSERNRKR